MNQHIKETDPVIAEIIGEELQRQNDHIELIASENWVSPAVREAAGSVLTNKYAEGYPGKRYYGGCEHVDRVEEIAIERAKDLFGCTYANVQPHSGSQANMAVYSALLQPGDRILGMNLTDGGHLTHGSPVNFSGKLYDFQSYGVGEDGYIDYDALEAQAKTFRPKLIVAGASAYPRVIDFKRLREIADEVGAYLMVDIAHIAGLVVAGDHPSPIPYADIVTTTTHKTLRGPRGGLILSSEEFAREHGLNKGVFPANQGGPLMHIIAAKAVCFKEAQSEEYKNYIHQVVKNAKALAEGLTARGVKLISGGTDNHLMLIDLRDSDLSGKDLEDRLSRANITANKNTVPGEKRSAALTSGVRIGTPAVTTRGFKEEEMDLIASCIADVIASEDNIPSVKKRIKELTDNYPLQ